MKFPKIMGIVLLLVLASPPIYGAERELYDEQAADGFSRCAAYYSLKYLGESEPGKKSGFRKITETNYGFAVMYSSDEYAQKAVSRERDAILADIKTIEHDGLGKYGQAITVKCAELLVERMKQLEDMGVVFR